MRRSPIRFCRGNCSANMSARGCLNPPSASLMSGFSVITAMARAVVRESGRYRVELDRAEPVTADVVILATAYGLQQPRSTGALAPYEIVSAERTSAARSMVLIGSGLTMVDVLLSARRDGFQGNAVVI